MAQVFDTVSRVPGYTDASIAADTSALDLGHRESSAYGVRTSASYPSEGPFSPREDRRGIATSLATGPTSREPLSAPNFGRRETGAYDFANPAARVSGLQNTSSISGGPLDIATSTAKVTPSQKPRSSEETRREHLHWAREMR